MKATTVHRCFCTSRDDNLWSLILKTFPSSSTSPMSFCKGLDEALKHRPLNARLFQKQEIHLRKIIRHRVLPWSARGSWHLTRWEPPLRLPVEPACGSSYSAPLPSCGAEKHFHLSIVPPSHKTILHILLCKNSSIQKVQKIQIQLECSNCSLRFPMHKNYLQR